MIGQLHGKIIHKAPPNLLLEVNDIGYELQASMNTFYQLPDIGKKITLHTHLHVREDAQLLYGFYTLSERSLFRALIKISGIGAKLALAILSGITPESFIHCIQTNDTATLIRMPGVGRKTAERLIIEMRDYLQKLEISNSGSSILGLKTPIAIKSQTIQDAISALIALGYKQQDAIRAISKINEPDLNTESLIRLALKKILGKK